MSLEAHVRITNPTGLHARPAVKLAQLAAGFDADVQVRVGDTGNWVKARSTAKLMKLKAGVNATLHFRAHGTQASDALDTLLDFVRQDFGEGPRSGSEASAEPAATEEREDAAAPTLAAHGDRVIGGEIASRGVAKGRLCVVSDAGRGERQAGTPDRERRVFLQGVRDAVVQLQGLANGTEDIASEVIAFQVGLLQDEAFIEPVVAEIARGTPADQAWDLYLAREIADYESAQDAHFRDRAADLRDLHERVARALCGATASSDAPGGAILIMDELTPSRFLEYDWTRLAGVATRDGSTASHVAMLARARGVPFMVKLARNSIELRTGTEAIIDAERGALLLEPSAQTDRSYVRLIEDRKARAEQDSRFLDKPAHTGAGDAITVYINVDDPAALTGVNVNHCDGIGLTRTEFLFQGRAGLPSEELQYSVYRRLVEWADGRAVTIRTLDAGGDKPVPGLTLEDERSPFLGVRGLRLSLARPDVFRVQLRALARAAAHGPLKVMLPMVTLPAELEQARAILDDELSRLARDGVAASRPSLGMMVEVPAAALCVEGFNADFLSIGTNDLVQYVMAAGRDSPQAALLQDPLHPAVMELIRRVAEHGAAQGIEVSVCGEMAAVPAHLTALIDAGVRSVSVPPAMLASTKATIAGI